MQACAGVVTSPSLGPVGCGSGVGRARCGEDIGGGVEDVVDMYERPQGSVYEGCLPGVSGQSVDGGRGRPAARISRTGVQRHHREVTAWVP